MKKSSFNSQSVSRRRALAVLAVAPASIALAAAAQPVQTTRAAPRPVREPLVTFRQFDRFGYKDQTGTVVHKPIFDGAGSFFDPLGRPRQITWVRIGKKFGYIDRQGKYAVRPSFDTIHEFSEGYAGFRQGGLYGYIDEAGRVAIQAQYNSIEPFSTGIAAVRLGDKIGWIDRTGQFFDRRPGDAAR